MFYLHFIMSQPYNTSKAPQSTHSIQSVTTHNYRIPLDRRKHNIQINTIRISPASTDPCINRALKTNFYD